MKSLRWLFLGLGLGLLASGCILTSGQIQIDFNLLDGNITSAGLVGMPVKLSQEEEYTDNKDKLKTLSDLALLGKIKNNTASPLDVEVWFTPTITTHTTESALMGDPSAVKIWGKFHVGANQTVQIDWNDSAALFTKAGKDALLKEAKDGDGDFSLYAIGSSGTYDFDVTNGSLVLILDAGI
jgi:hypothetical protein